MATEAQYGWAAGFTDGEGCISIQHQRRHYCVRFHLVQKDIRPLVQFAEIFGLTEKIHQVTRANRRHAYHRLTISGARAAEVLGLMLPYLTIKREVAEVAIKLQEMVASAGSFNRFSVMPDDELRRRQSLYEKAIWLNSGRWAAAETKPEGRPDLDVCDSPNCTDGKGAEVAETTTRLQ